jgi:hypothetical protein
LFGAILLAGVFGQSLPNPASPEPAAAADPADVSISKTASLDPAVFGQKVTYTVKKLKSLLEDANWEPRRAGRALRRSADSCLLTLT